MKQRTHKRLLSRMLSGLLVFAMLLSSAMPVFASDVGAGDMQPVEAQYTVYWMADDETELAHETRVGAAGTEVSVDPNDLVCLDGFTFRNDDGRNVQTSVLAEDGSTALKLYFDVPVMEEPIPEEPAAENPPVTEPATEEGAKAEDPAEDGTNADKPNEKDSTEDVKSDAKAEDAKAEDSTEKDSTEDAKAEDSTEKDSTEDAKAEDSTEKDSTEKDSANNSSESKETVTYLVEWRNPFNQLIQSETRTAEEGAPVAVTEDDKEFDDTGRYFFNEEADNVLEGEAAEGLVLVLYFDDTHAIMPMATTRNEFHFVVDMTPYGGTKKDVVRTDLHPNASFMSMYDKFDWSEADANFDYQFDHYWSNWGDSPAGATTPGYGTFYSQNKTDQRNARWYFGYEKDEVSVRRITWMPTFKEGSVTPKNGFRVDGVITGDYEKTVKGNSVPNLNGKESFDLDTYVPEDFKSLLSNDLYDFTFDGYEVVSGSGALTGHMFSTESSYSVIQAKYTATAKSKFKVNVKITGAQDLFFEGKFKNCGDDDAQHSLKDNFSWYANEAFANSTYRYVFKGYTVSEGDGVLLDPALEGCFYNPGSGTSVVEAVYESVPRTATAHGKIRVTFEGVSSSHLGTYEYDFGNVPVDTVSVVPYLSNMFDWYDDKTMEGYDAGLRVSSGNVQILNVGVAGGLAGYVVRDTSDFVLEMTVNMVDHNDLAAQKPYIRCFVNANFYYYYGTGTRDYNSNSMSLGVVIPTPGSTMSVKPYYDKIAASGRLDDKLYDITFRSWSWPWSQGGAAIQNANSQSDAVFVFPNSSFVASETSNYLQMGASCTYELHPKKQFSVKTVVTGKQSLSSDSKFYAVNPDGSDDGNLFPFIDRSKWDENKYDYEFKGFTLNSGSGSFTDASDESSVYHPGDGASVVVATYEATERVHYKVNTEVHGDEDAFVEGEQQTGLFGGGVELLPLVDKSGFHTDEFVYEFEEYEVTGPNGYHTVIDDEAGAFVASMDGDFTITAKYKATRGIRVHLKYRVTYDDFYDLDYDLKDKTVVNEWISNTFVLMPGTASINLSDYNQFIGSTDFQYQFDGYSENSSTCVFDDALNEQSTVSGIYDGLEIVCDYSVVYFTKDNYYFIIYPSTNAGDTFDPIILPTHPDPDRQYRVIADWTLGHSGMLTNSFADAYPDAVVKTETKLRYYNDYGWSSLITDPFRDASLNLYKSDFKDSHSRGAHVLKGDVYWSFKGTYFEAKNQVSVNYGGTRGTETLSGGDHAKFLYEHGSVSSSATFWLYVMSSRDWLLNESKDHELYDFEFNRWNGISLNGNSGFTVTNPSKYDMAYATINTKNGSRFGTITTEECYTATPKANYISVNTVCNGDHEFTVSSDPVIVNMDGSSVNPGQYIDKSRFDDQKYDYKFLGYTVSGGSGESIGDKLSEDTSVTVGSPSDGYCILNANYAATAKPQLFYDTKGGSAIDPTYPEDGRFMVTRRTPVKDGFVFKGWSMSEEASDVDYLGGDTLSGAKDRTLYAVWAEDTGGDPSTPGQPAAKTYTLTYDTKTDVTIDPQKSNTGSFTVTRRTPVKEGFTFAGWSLTEEPKDPSEVDYFGGDVFPAQKDITLHAVFVKNSDVKIHTISYDTKGGSAVAAGLADDGHFMVTRRIPEKKGYVFAGWSVDEKATGIDYIGGDKVSAMDSMILYAVWVKESVSNTYALSYDTQGGSEVMDTDSVDGKFMVTRRTPKKDGKVFLGWSLYPDDNDIDFIAGDFVLADKDITLYAVYADAADAPEVTTYTITYDTRGGSAVAETKSYAGTFTVTRRTPELSGKVFAGWTLDPDSKNPVDVDYLGGDTFPAEKDVTLYALYKNADIVVNVNGGSDVETNVTVVENKYIITITIPDKAGYDFPGWDTDGDGEPDVLPDEPIETDDPSQVIDAVWNLKVTPAQYVTTNDSTWVSDITWDKSMEDGGNVTRGIDDALVDEEGRALVQIPATTPKRSGYAFRGWDLGSPALAARDVSYYQAGDKVYMDEIDRLYEQGLSFTAVWEPETNPDKPGDNTGDKPGDNTGDKPGNKPIVPGNNGGSGTTGGNTGSSILSPVTNHYSNSGLILTGGSRYTNRSGMQVTGASGYRRAARTGDTADTAGFGMLMLGSMAVIVLMLEKKRRLE